MSFTSSIRWVHLLPFLALSGALTCTGCSDGEITPSNSATLPGRAPASPRRAGIAANRRNMIVIIGDGMQMAHEVAASRYLFGVDQGLSFHTLLPVQAFVTTWDVSGYDLNAARRGLPAYRADTFNPLIGYDPAVGGEAPYPLIADTPERRQHFLTSPYPDSASTATAMSTGLKTDYNNIAWFAGDPRNGAIETSAARLRRVYGMSIGLVTTGPISHATPSSWFAHNVNRFNYLELGHEILTVTQPDVAIGAGVGPNEGNYVDAADLAAAKASGKWVVVERSAGVNGAESLQAGAERAVKSGKGLIGVFGGTAGVFESPVPSDTPLHPSITRGSSENPILAEAVVSALTVLSDNPNGFFALIEQADIDWSNHSNDFSRMIGCVWDLHEAVKAVVGFIDRPDDEIDWDNTTVLVTADHANSYLRLERQLEPGDLPTQLISESGAFVYPEGSVTYGHGSHTGELVTLHARGHVAESVARYATAYPGLPIVDNTNIYDLTLEAAAR